MGVFDSFGNGVRLGEQIGNDTRNARAYRSGGMDAVGEQAFRTGDLQTGMAARQFQDQDTQRAYERLNTIGPRAQNVIRAGAMMANSDPSRARQWLESQSRPFLDFGFNQQQIDGAIARLTDADPNVRAEAVQEFNQAFSQHKDPNWSIRGNRVIGVDPETGAVSEGGTLPEGTSGRMATPEEVQSMGFQGDTAVWIGADGTPHVLQNPHYESPRGQQYSTLPPGFVLDDGQQ